VVRNQLRLAILVGVGFFTLSSCQSFFEKKDNQGRVFKVHADWVRASYDIPFEKNRKSHRMTPILYKDMVLQGNSIDGMAAYKPENGEVIWKKKIENGVEATASEFKGRVYLGGADSYFYALNSKTGQEVWKFKAQSENISEPLYDQKEGRVFFVSGSHILYALDAESGQQVWSHSRQDSSVFSVRGGGQPALSQGVLYAGFSDGSLVALNAKTGSVNWEIQLNKNKKFKDIDSSPVIDGDRLYISGFDDKLYCISLQKGDVIWKIDGGGFSEVNIFGNKIIYSTSTGQVVAINRENGQKLWTYNVKNGVATASKIYKGLVVFGESQGRLVFLDADTGLEKNHFEPGHGLLSSPAVDEKNNRVYFISGEGNLYSIHADWEAHPFFSFID